MGKIKPIKILITSRKERAFVRNRTIFNIIEALKEKIEVEDLWILYDSGKSTKNSGEKLEYNYRFFEDYNNENILEIIENENPDLLISLNDFDYFGRAFILAAKYKGIPTVLSLQDGFYEIIWGNKELVIAKGRFNILKQRGGFVLNKYKLLLNTYKKIHYSFPKIVKNFVKDMVDPFLLNEPAGKYGCDLILLHNDSKEILEDRGIKSKIFVTGDPKLDDLFKEINKIDLNAENKSEKIVLVTTAVVEHGIWTRKMWENTIKEIITNLQNQELVIKIHPVSERKEDYEKIINQFNKKITILQKENLIDVLKDSKVVISYGTGSWAIMEALLLHKPIIILNPFDQSIDKSPYIKQKVALEVTQIKKLNETIKNIHLEKIDDKTLNKFISNQLFKFDGNASKRSADAILNLIIQKNN